MLTGQTQPLEMAKKVLLPETLQAASKAPYNQFGWAILDRWAYNSPEALTALETQGEVVLLGRLLEQQQLEQQVLTTQEALEAQATGVQRHEILQQYLMETELR
ncbi:hypothetical protein ACFFU8_08975 [Chromobacterium piscinae]|uniref:hypothetical protein n=1 Tax=Chromobacterium piscinae TaxID=686831 RepID=UPI001E5F3DEB|nr:hypothetical protein [Chromobacterium piscinae]MCD5327964.1 hypothetical protein [Chromobacterium piscinae]